MKQNTSNMPKVVEDCHELLAWIIPVLDQFPRNRRFTLGERIETGLLIVLENLILAAYQKSKSDSFKSDNLQFYMLPGGSGRFVEQQSAESPVGQSQQERHR